LVVERPPFRLPVLRFFPLWWGFILRFVLMLYFSRFGYGFAMAKPITVSITGALYNHDFTCEF